MKAMEPQDAYRLWAPTYAAETVVSFLDEELAVALSPALAGKRLLDAGCGTGRRLVKARAALAIGTRGTLGGLRHNNLCNHQDSGETHDAGQP